jgi:hypothetical protein
LQRISSIKRSLGIISHVTVPNSDNPQTQTIKQVKENMDNILLSLNIKHFNQVTTTFFAKTNPIELLGENSCSGKSS